MNTLYDLLGALPRDDAEGLRSAFRKAVKGTHPDLRPDDPEAALKSREIIRANEILGDPEQRAAYDHLLGLARQEQVSVSKQAVFVRVHRLASGVIAFAGVSIATVGGYLLLIHMSAASVAPLDEADTDAGKRATPEIAAVAPAAPPVAAADAASSTKREGPGVPTETAPPPAVQPNAESAPPAVVVPDPTLTEARSLRARGMSAYSRGDLDGAIANLDQALQRDPKFLAAYIDRGMILYRARKLARASADGAGGKRIEADRAKSAPTSAGKPHADQTAFGTPMMPLAQGRKAAQKQAKEEAFTPLWTMR